MRIDRVQSHQLTSLELLLVRLLRRWSAARTLEQNALVAITRMAADAGEPVVVAVALHSLLQITEGCLCRPLEAGCHGSPTLSRDEKALLTMLAAAPAVSGPLASTQIPHGLPGVLCWAVASLREVLGDRLPPVRMPVHGCPFASADEHAQGNSGGGSRSYQSSRSALPPAVP